LILGRSQALILSSLGAGGASALPTEIALALSLENVELPGENPPPLAWYLLGYRVREDFLVNQMG
jgi:hypothetical protein